MKYKQFLTKEPTDQPYTSLNIDHLKNRRYKCSSSYLFQETKLIVLYDFTVSRLVLYISSKQLYCMRVRGTYWNSPPGAISRGIWPFHRIIISISLTLLILYLEKNRHLYKLNCNFSNASISQTKHTTHDSFSTFFSHVFKC